MTWKKAFEKFVQEVDACLEDRVITFVSPLDSRGEIDAKYIRLFPRQAMEQWGIIQPTEEKMKTDFFYNQIDSENYFKLVSGEADVMISIAARTPETKAWGIDLWVGPGNFSQGVNCLEKVTGLTMGDFFVQTIIPCSDDSYFRRVLQMSAYAAKALDMIIEHETEMKEFKQYITDNDMKEILNFKHLSDDSQTVEQFVHDFSGRLYTATESLQWAIESAYFDASKNDRFAKKHGRNLSDEERVKSFLKEYHPKLAEALNQLRGTAQYHDLKRLFRNPLQHGYTKCTLKNDFDDEQVALHTDGKEVKLIDKLTDIYETLLPKMANIIAITYDDGYQKRFQRMLEDLK